MKIFSFAPCVLVSILGFTASAALAVEQAIPAPPQLAAKSYVLMDAASGKVLVDHNGDERLRV